MVGRLGSAFGDGLWVASWAVMIVALLLTVVSMLDYVAKARHLLGVRRGRGKDIGIRGRGRSASWRAQADIGARGRRAVGARVDRRVRRQDGGHGGEPDGRPVAARSPRCRAARERARRIVSYATEVKERVLGVLGQVLSEHGAVS